MRQAQGATHNQGIAYLRPCSCLVLGKSRVNVKSPAGTLLLFLARPYLFCLQAIPDGDASITARLYLRGLRQPACNPQFLACKMRDIIRWKQHTGLKPQQPQEKSCQQKGRPYLLAATANPPCRPHQKAYQHYHQRHKRQSRQCQSTGNAQSECHQQ